MRNYVKAAHLKESYPVTCSEWVDENFLMLIKRGYIIGKHEAGEIYIDEPSFACLIDDLNILMAEYGGQQIETP